MPFPEFDPVLIHLGPLPIRWYALAYVAGIVLGWWYASRLAKTERLWSPGKPPVTGPQLDDLVLWITLGVILGGRFGYALFYKPAMFAQIFTGDSWGERLELLQLWTGGMSFHGGFLGVVIAIALYANRQKINPLSLGDLIAPVAPIGLLFGRIANFINGELWGRETTVPWAIRFCNARIEQMYGFCPAGNEPRHPSQLYEAGLEGLLLLIILSLAIWKWKMLKRPGFVTGLFLLGYGVCRAALENVRQPDAGLENLPLGLTMGMILSIPMMLAGVWLIWRALKKPVVAEA
ncbi:phosphatidylglycerol:prolipoprotein diacylglycerol transferase [Brevundimonas bullata]|uniref:Phosphatidylglycerol--prolipoprotein diacylglyceryl transferase n=1 Tax=Brevundimonas bullata TaxID=13160 RepID=A0A7W7IQF5_9CAUL|nr:prolipoprotein diacylglyceryl transferase [Brevundimonas bullata]MBB4798654.1 phosphatidylglycerol:prolipoprotein diacylglycerol transferase [Brevundimonas bullata]MBB6383031.1 phosphatidylglycerol:prolipoprotein diacylglycerol transferase [Brevundimonas bullata]